MRVQVTDRCQGHARCIVFAPEIFDIDEDGYAFVIEGRETVAPGDDHLARAIASCPEEAIVLLEEEPG
jgi:ferredoxin